MLSYFTTQRYLGWVTDFKFIVSFRCDSDYKEDPDTRQSVNNSKVSVDGALAQWRSASQKHVPLSVTKIEHVAAVTLAQDKYDTIESSVGIY